MQLKKKNERRKTDNSQFRYNFDGLSLGLSDSQKKKKKKDFGPNLRDKILLGLNANVEQVTL